MQTIMINQSLTRGQKPLFECPEGFIIAGGAIRRWYSGEPQDGDIDLFCSDSEIKQKWMDEKNRAGRDERTLYVDVFPYSAS